MKLILFDIDGTLIDSGGAGTRSLDMAFKELFSVVKAFEGISMAGKTDAQIVREGLKKYNIPSNNGLVPEVLSVYLKHLSVEIANDKKHVKPGIREALEILKEEKESCRLGLLTGNIEQGARIKLEFLGLNDYFAFGAFGSDDEDRNKLLPVAVKKFEQSFFRSIAFRDCIIVGDTPRDVDCAKPYGAFCVGVATGPYPVDALVKAGADVVFETLSDTGAFLETLKL